jgi:hypothetical protein
MPKNLLVKSFDAVVTFAPGERADVSYITTDVVDNEGDVVVAAGVDYTSVFMKNRVVMAKHDYQSWPVGKCEWIKAQKATPQRQFNGLIAKTIYDTDPDADRLWGMVQRGLVSGKSIGFRPPDDFNWQLDWGPATQQELKERPEWESARQIIRRCVLLEYSIVPIPMNQESLVLAVSKGLELPSYLRAFVMPETTKPEDKALSESSGTNGGYTGYSPDEENHDPDPTNTEPVPSTEIKAGDYVEWGKGMHSGCGRVKSIHTDGKVPNVQEDVEGTEDDPAARVRVYHKHEDGKFRPTQKFMGHKMKSLSKIKDYGDHFDQDDNEYFDPEKEVTLPPHRTQAQVQESLTAKLLARFSPERIDALATKAAERAQDRYLGAV